MYVLPETESVSFGVNHGFSLHSVGADGVHRVCRKPHFLSRGNNMRSLGYEKRPCEAAAAVNGVIGEWFNFRLAPRR